MDFRICIQVASIHIKHWKNTGDTGADISILIDISAPKPVYQNLYELVKEKDYFVLTTNVDHCFQKTGFDKNRIFYTQGDYGLFQCSEPCHAFYVCLNQSEAYAPEEIRKKSVCMNEDIGEILKC